jgi:transposase-like protein
VALHSAAIRATIIELKCPHCGFAQARARKPAKSIYACKRCHKRFTREQAAKQK